MVASWVALKVMLKLLRKWVTLFEIKLCRKYYILWHSKRPYPAKFKISNHSVHPNLNNREFTQMFNKNLYAQLRTIQCYSKIRKLRCVNLVITTFWCDDTTKSYWVITTIKNNQTDTLMCCFQVLKHKVARRFTLLVSQFPHSHTERKAQE